MLACLNARDNTAHWTRIKPTSVLSRRSMHLLPYQISRARPGEEGRRSLRFVTPILKTRPWPGRVSNGVLYNETKTLPPTIDHPAVWSLERCDRHTCGPMIIFEGLPLHLRKFGANTPIPLTRAKRSGDSARHTYLGRKFLAAVDAKITGLGRIRFYENALTKGTLASFSHRTHLVLSWTLPVTP